MIDPKELRIGNCILLKGEISKISGMGENFYLINCMIYGTEKPTVKFKPSSLIVPSGSLPLADMNPIPLTEEILLRCGFETEDGWWFDKTIYPLTKSTYSKLSISPKEDFGVIIFAYLGDEFQVMEFAELNSVHKLQNIYFTLTGKELNVANI